MLSRKTVYSGTNKLILSFPYSLHILCTKVYIVYFHTVLSMFLFLFYCSYLKVGVVQSSKLYLFHKKSTIGQLNAQIVKTENEQYTLSNILYIVFQNLKQMFLKGRQINQKIVEMEFVFWTDWGPTTLSKNAL